MRSRPGLSGRQLRGRGAELRGRRGEFWAALFLMCRCYRILGRRVRTKAGEIDLIALSPRGVVCFIEVKVRPGEAEAALSLRQRQQTRIARAGALYLAARPSLARKPVRYDIVVLRPGGWPRHLRDAFRPQF